VKNKWLLIILAATLALVGLWGCTNEGLTGAPADWQVNLNSQQEGIWVSGTGVVTVTPDIAILRLGVEAQATSIADARSQAAEAMGRLMTALTDNNVAEEDIQTQYFNIRQIKRWDGDDEEEIVVGYLVTNKVTAKIRNVDEVGSIIDAVAEAGGDLTRIDSIGFSVDDPTEYYGQAREQAMADAKAKAEQLAELAGGKLGRVTYISESTQTPPIIRDVYEGATKIPMPETPISLGEMEISLTVQVAYTILDQ